MENKSSSINLRFLVIYIFITICVSACIFRLFDLQIVKGDEYKEQSEKRLVRAAPIKAPRGEMIDRYGRPLVTNRMGFYIQIQKLNSDDESLNHTLLELLRIMQEENAEYTTTFPIKGEEPYYYEFLQGVENSDDMITNWKKERKLEKYQTPEEIVNHYKTKFKISDNFSPQDILTLVSLRYEMELRDFGSMNPYTFATDVPMEVVQKVKEQSLILPGISIEIEPIREFPNGALAAHILGRTGIIYKEEYDLLKEQGYGMNDFIGKDGMEKILEKYLKGKDGYRSVEQTKNGGIAQVLKNQPATPGNYAVLTLDLKLQQTMEEALKTRIEQARSGRAKDAYCGAAVAVEVTSGEVLAMASYPSYDPAEYNSNYSQLLQDPNNPLFNRALCGVYEPGSTFKPLVAIAALEEDIITPSTQILDKGVYEYYAPSYTPSCLEWSSRRRTHGSINAAKAIGVSCNYFFYEIGRLMGIETMNSYARSFGLGEPTGIELYEETGNLAGPEFRAKFNAQWYPGDTIQAAIGQSDNGFTPAQIVEYLTTILNKGTRRNLHLLKEIKSYETGETVYHENPKIMSQIEMKDSTYQAVIEGMRQVVDDGTARAVFSDFSVNVGGKTGTAQVSNGHDNVLFMGFAPLENPQIAVAVVLEHGASSSYAAMVARDIFETYLETEQQTNTPTEEMTQNGLLE